MSYNWNLSFADDKVNRMFNNFPVYFTPITRWFQTNFAF